GIRINDDRCLSKAETSHRLGNVVTNSGQRHECFLVARHFSTEIGDKALTQSLERWNAPCKAERPEQASYFSIVRVSQSSGCRESRHEPCEDSNDLIRTRSTQHHLRDQPSVRTRIVTPRKAAFGFEPPVDDSPAKESGPPLPVRIYG